MSAKSDKVSGRVKQATGAITGDEELKSEGQVQEDKGKLKDTLDSVVDKASHALDDVKHKADKA